MPDPRITSALATNAILAAVYFVAGKLGLMLAFVNPSATAVWPPTGIALAAFLTLGYWVWPGIALGAFLVNLTTAGSMAASTGIAAGNTLEGLAGAYLANTFARGRHAFNRPQDVLRFTLLAGLLSTTVSATLGITSLSLVGSANWADFGRIWLIWWLGDVGGALIVAPFLVLWSANPRIGWNRAQVVEGGLLLLSLVLVGQVVFGGWLPFDSKGYPLTYLCLPSLVWAAFRFGPRETATATFILAGLTIWGTLAGYGPFVRGTQNQSLLLLQAFMGFTAVLSLCFAAVVTQRKQADERRERLLLKLQKAIDEVKTLRGLLPMCAGCKKIRNEQGDWEYIETYITEHSEAKLTHGMCPECLMDHYKISS